MRIAVFGAGGVGGNFGGRLARRGEDVVFIARGDHLAAMRETGLRVTSDDESFTIEPVQAIDEPASIGQVDVILVAVKAWQVADAAAKMQPLVGEETVVVPLCNGIDAPGTLASVLGPAYRYRELIGQP